ncbi:hypothetical protein [Paraburkholderia bengalensis]|uniref:hypothetical protein n=1 Tax=Paraburkholderia bengalensis TaxID=2747562 RepID=UPI003AF71E5B
MGEYVEAARRLRKTYPHARFQLLGPVGVDNPSAISQADVDTWVREGVIDYLGEAQTCAPRSPPPIASCCLRIAKACRAR